MREQFDEGRRILAESIQLSIEGVPAYKVKTTLQRSIQILKRHRDIMFEDDQDDKPISIIITTLAAHAYGNESNIVDALTNIISQIPDYIDDSNEITWIPNPVNPLENFADKWELHPQRKEKFYTWLSAVKQDMGNALSTSSHKELSEGLKRSFGGKLIDSIDLTNPFNLKLTLHSSLASAMK